MTDRIEAILALGRRARAVLNEPTVIEAIDHIADQTQRQWRATAASQSQHRETLFHQIAALDAVKAQLKAWADAADFEQAKLSKANERKLRVVR